MLINGAAEVIQQSKARRKNEFAVAFAPVRLMNTREVDCRLTLNRSSWRHRQQHSRAQRMKCNRSYVVSSRSGASDRFSTSHFKMESKLA